MAVIHYRGGSRADIPGASRPRPRNSSVLTPKRIYLFVFFSLLWLFAVAVRMGDVQIRQSAGLVKRAQRQQEGTIAVSASRGAIYDRFGEELALSTPVDSIGVFPDKVHDVAMTATLLRQVLKIDRATLEQKLRGKGFDFVRRFAEPGEADRVRRLNLAGIQLDKENKRYYPKGRVAVHVLGAVGTEHFGLAGLEESFETQLRGTPGSKLVHFDASGKYYASRILKEPVPGADLYLTLDQRIQTLAERELRKAVTETQASAGTIVIMNPRSGDLLAVASWPTFDPYERPRSEEAMNNLWRNYAISNLIEPGSTFKLVTMSAVIEENLTTPNEVVNCENGAYYVGRRLIQDHKPYGMLTVAEVMANSSNIGALKLAQRLRGPRFYEYIRRFGFGVPTGLPLPNDIEGLLRPDPRWGTSSLESISFGQEIGVSAMQMARATAVIANGGMLVQPRIVDGIAAPGGLREPYKTKPPQRVITVETAATVRAMMEKTVAEGTGKNAQVPGYRIAGKTGTAQKIDPDTRAYSETDYIANFVGFAPVNDPKIVVVIVIDSPKGVHTGGMIAAPVFPDLARQTLRFLDVPPELPVEPPKRAPRRQPRELVAQAEEPWIEETVSRPGGAIVVPVLDDPEHRPQANAPGRADEAPRVASAGDKVALQVTDRVVPDFRGHTVREVVAESVSLGLRLDIQGRGVALRQSPPAGTPVAYGSTIRVAFARAVKEVSAGR
jgi:cell division protein FtsI (penicillin-binding protein 3)